jgi:hypothetical protein
MTMEQYNPENVELVDLDTLQKMLAEGVIQGLIGFTKSGQMLVAGQDVKNMWLVPDKDKDLPLSGMDVLAFASLRMCCIDNTRHMPPVKVPGGYVCQDLKQPCQPGDIDCGFCRSI